MFVVFVEEGRLCWIYLKVIVNDFCLCLLECKLFKKMNICLCIKKLLEKNKFISNILYVYIFIKIGFS